MQHSNQQLESYVKHHAVLIVCTCMKTAAPWHEWHTCMITHYNTHTYNTACVIYIRGGLTFPNNTKLLFRRFRVYQTTCTISYYYWQRAKNYHKLANVTIQTRNFEIDISLHDREQIHMHNKKQRSTQIECQTIELGSTPRLTQCIYNV